MNTVRAAAVRVMPPVTETAKLGYLHNNNEVAA